MQAGEGEEETAGSAQAVQVPEVLTPGTSISLPESLYPEVR